MEWRPVQISSKFNLTWAHVHVIFLYLVNNCMCDEYYPFLNNHFKLKGIYAWVFYSDLILKTAGTGM